MGSLKHKSPIATQRAISKKGERDSKARFQKLLTKKRRGETLTALEKNELIMGLAKHTK
jgi:hypothetical protein